MRQTRQTESERSAHDARRDLSDSSPSNHAESAPFVCLDTASSPSSSTRLTAENGRLSKVHFMLPNVSERRMREGRSGRSSAER